MSLRPTSDRRYIIWACAFAIIASCIIRYADAPTFWLDEAIVAQSLREPSIESVFGRLERGMYFPRLYLALIASIREVFGYEIWSLRLLPSLWFIAATILWARLLAIRSGTFPVPCLVAGSLLIGGSFWLEQSIQLKQYSLDVLVALIPFILSDGFFDQTLSSKIRRWRAALLTIPCFLSYTYIFALCSRVIGWYGNRALWGKRRIDLLGMGAMALPAVIGVASMWAIEFRSGADLTGYWKPCILSSRLQEGLPNALELTGNFIWGWHHGRLMPLVVAIVVPLQVAGLYWAVKRLLSGEHDEHEKRWGSRTLGSLVLLISVILASLIISYPICAGRLTLFAQVHTQILIIEGALFFSTFYRRRWVARVFLSLAVAIVMLYSVDRYIDFIRSEPPDNIRPMLSLIRPEISNTVWVHPCSIAQVRSLPDPLPVDHVVTNTRRSYPEPGTSVWVLWTHMSEGDCTDRMNELRRRAVRWEVVHEGFSRGLALAKF